MFDPTTVALANLAIRATRLEAESALPDSPVSPDPLKRAIGFRTRKGLARHLRSTAQRRNRLAERFDPCW